MSAPPTKLPAPVVTDATVLPAARAVLQKKARSFAWATTLLPAEVKDDVAITYAFCRLVDDAVDEAPSRDEGERAIRQLRAEFEGEAPARPLVAAFHAVVARRQIPVWSVRALLDGMESDLDDVDIATEDALVRYAYHAAGSVGGMMTALLGNPSEAATHFAVDLGIAMQLTNICRDVDEDLDRGRVYLPRKMLEAAGQKGALEKGAPTARVVVKRVLALADQYYRSAQVGLAYLPWRARFGIGAALRIYRAIGTVLASRGHDVWAGRASTTKADKLWHTVIALAMVPLLPLLKRPHDARLHDALHGLAGIHRGGRRVQEALPAPR